MKKILGLISLIAMALMLAGCPPKDTRPNAKFPDRLPGDNKPPAPNCAADGPGCEQFNPNL